MNTLRKSKIIFIVGAITLSIFSYLQFVHTFFFDAIVLIITIIGYLSLGEHDKDE